jgi:hypothetical protein
MSIEAAFQELPARLVDLQTALGYLNTFIEDKPHAHALADKLGETATDLSARVDGALVDARAAEAAVQGGGDPVRARTALARCHEGLNAVSRCLLTELTAEKQWAELAGLGPRLRGEWPGWTRAVRGALEACQPALHDVNQALFRCWQELAEHSGGASISVRATSIGQRISIENGGNYAE